ncbi:MAG: sigma-70 family RNA polymerase sigma factor, partial [Bacteroidota bacterium]
QFRGTAKMSTWLYRIAINTALLYRKRSTRRSGVERPGLDRVPSRGYNPVAATDATTEQEQQLQQLRQAIQQLEKQDRIIITLVLENMSYQEISEVVGITVNYIGVKINRIKNKLSKKLKAYG